MFVAEFTSQFGEPACYQAGVFFAGAVSSRYWLAWMLTLRIRESRVRRMVLCHK
jgi:hypothetical protein